MINTAKSFLLLPILLLCTILFLAGCAEKPEPKKLYSVQDNFQFHKSAPLPKETHDIIIQPNITPYQCTVTPSFDLHFPDVQSIGKTNNLWRKTGSAEVAYGKPIYIKGIVTDKNCVPLPNVAIEVWQADDTGNYQLGDEDSIDAVLLDNESATNPDFAGSGTAYTNNMGEYSFITIFPGTQGNEVPHLKFRVKHPNFDPIISKMYFETEDNSNDEDYINLPVKERKSLTAVTDPRGLTPDPSSMTHYFNIALDGEGRYRSY